MLHKLEKGNRDDQELTRCYCAQQGSTKKHGRKWLLSTTHTWRTERQLNLEKCSCVQVKLWNLVIYDGQRGKIMELMQNSWRVLWLLKVATVATFGLESPFLLTWGNQHHMAGKDHFIFIPFFIFSSNYGLLNIAGNRLWNQVDFYFNPKQQEPEDFASYSLPAESCPVFWLLCLWPKEMNNFCTSTTGCHLGWLVGSAQDIFKEGGKCAQSQVPKSTL